MLCFVVVMQSFIMNSREVFIHIHQGCFAGTGAIVRSPQCQWSKPDGYGKISQCITTTKHSKAKTVCIFLGIYCTWTVLSFLCSRDFASSDPGTLPHPSRESYASTEYFDSAIQGLMPSCSGQKSNIYFTIVSPLTKLKDKSEWFIRMKTQ